VNAIVLAYLLHQPLAVFPVIGADRSDQLEDSIGALEVSLLASELQMLEDAAGSGIHH
jgi:aryl-alcohol dehydrogenase-like predicted oxidoreductase